MNEPDGGWSLYDDPGRVVYRGNPGTRFACQAGPGLIILYESKTRRKYLVNLDLGRRVTEWEWGRHGGIGSYGEGLVPLKVEGKWGYIDRRGHTVIAPAFAGAGPFRGGLAKVCKDGGWGFIDRSGRQVVGCRFTWVDDFIDGLAIVRTQPNRFGVIDRTGKFVIKPAYLQLKMLTCSQRRPSDSAGPFGRSSCDVLAKAGRMMDPKGPRLFVASKTYGTCGLIDATGAVMCPFFLSSDNLLDEGLVFSEGLAMVVRKTPDGPKVGFVDPTGRIAIRPRFDYAEDFSGGLSRVTVGSSAENICGLQDPNSARWGYIDRKGRVVWEPTR